MLTNDHIAAATPTQIAAPRSNDQGISPFMQSSLPAAASGADLYARQFYAGGRLPQRRYLPVGIQAGPTGIGQTGAAGVPGAKGSPGSTGPAGTGLAGSSSLTANGYITFANGFLMQWVTGTYDASMYNGTVVAVNFPIAFPSACFCALVSTATTGTDYAEEALFTVTATSLTSASVFSARNADHSANPIAPVIVAYGN